MRFRTTCNVCGDSFKFNPLKRGGRFCSPDCRNNKPDIGQDEEMIEEKCSICGDKFAYSNFENGVFCSPECVDTASHKIEKSDTENCRECGSKFIYNSSRRDRQFCSEMCYRNNCRSDGKGRISRKYRSYKKDHNKCEVCHNNVDQLEVHHILPVRFDNTYINKEENLIALCDRCHSSVDSHRRGIDLSEKEQKWRLTEFRKVSEDKRSKMIQNIVKDDKSRKFIKILMYNSKV